MKATARAHPIEGLVKYHGMRDDVLRLPYHDSISLCTAPSNTTTTVEFDDSLDSDLYVIDGEEVTGRAAERVRNVVDHVRTLADTDDRVRLESENSFPTNVGFGSSASGFAAAAMALTEAAELDLTLSEISTIARRGSASAARAVTGGFSHLRAGLNDEDCYSEAVPTPEDFREDIRVIGALVPSYKETEHAHEEAAQSHMFDARMAHVRGQIAKMRDALRDGSFHRVFELAEHDTLSLTATTMTGPSGWVYWQPETIEIFHTVRDLRTEADIPVYFSADTGASVYVNTTAEYEQRVEDAIAACGVETRRWKLGGSAHCLEDDALF